MKFGDEPTKQAIDPTKIGRYRYNFGWNGGTTPKNPSFSAGKSSANLGTWTCGGCLNYNRWNICRSWDAVEALKNSRANPRQRPFPIPGAYLHSCTWLWHGGVLGTGSKLKSQKTLPDVGITIYWICFMVLFLLWYYGTILLIWSHFDQLKSLRGMHFFQMLMVFTPSSDPVFGVINVNCLILIHTLGNT